MLDTSKQNKKEQGSIMLITAIILLILTLIVVGALKLSNMQFNLSQMQRNTSNTYYVAEAGAEKAIETINKSIETKLPDIVKNASNVFLELDTSLSDVGKQRHLVVNADQTIRKNQAVKTTHKYDEFQYTNDKIQVNTHMYAEKKADGTTMAEAPITFSQYVRYELFDYLLKYYFVKDNYYADTEYKTINAVGVLGVLATDPKPMVYEVETDKYGENYVTLVQVIPKAKKLPQASPSDPIRWNRDTFEIISVSRTVYKKDDGSYDYNKVYDEEKVVTEVAIQIPSNLEHEFREYYEWIANPAEIVDNPITCFSDLIVDGDDNILQVNDGDVLVKGIKQISTGANAIADADITGGVIASNGGKIELINSTVGGTFDPKKNANLYTLSNVVVTNGWGDTSGDSSKYDLDTSINVQGDVIANSINIIDDFYEGSVNQTPFNDSFKGQNEFIKVGMNAFVDNDVMIDRWILGTINSVSGKKASSGGYIQVNGTIFGISNGSRTFEVTNPDSTTQLIVDPNTSSGVYSQGKDTLITADRMLIAGQPFITLSETAYPKKLFESIGEPFNGVASLDGYGEDELASAANDAYLKAGSPFIDSATGGSKSIDSKKVATNFATSYTIASVSAINSGERASEGISQTAIDLSKPGITVKPSSVFSSPNELPEFMFGGSDSSPYINTSYTLDLFTSENNNYGSEASYDSASDEGKKQMTAYININPVANFYLGLANNAGYLKMYNKIFVPSSPILTKMTSFRGVQAYMTAMRGVFYGQFNIVDATNGVVKEQLLNFSDVVDVSKVDDNDWSYATPILAKSFTPSDNVISIGDFYTGVGASGQMQPTIIVNKGEETITIKAESGYDTFKGIIISKGPVVLDAEDVTELKIEGVIIVGGPEETALTNEEIYKTGENKGLSVKGKVTVTKGSNTLLLDIDAANRKVYRGVLDALKITNYAGISSSSTAAPLAQALGEYDNGSTTKLRYALGKVGYSNKTYLYMDTKQIYLKIQSQQKQ